jgi:hypothetical protein
MLEESVSSIKNNKIGLRVESSVVKCLPSMCKVQDSIHSTKKKRKKKKKEQNHITCKTIDGTGDHRVK